MAVEVIDDPKEYGTVIVLVVIFWVAEWPHRLGWIIVRQTGKVVVCVLELKVHFWLRLIQLEHPTGVLPGSEPVQITSNKESGNLDRPAPPRSRRHRHSSFNAQSVNSHLVSRISGRCLPTHRIPDKTDLIRVYPTLIRLICYHPLCCAYLVMRIPTV